MIGRDGRAAPAFVEEWPMVLAVPPGMIGWDEALRRVLDATPVLPPTRVALTGACGLVLAEPVVAEEDLPPFPAATMDGYAVVAADGPGWRELVGEQLAGYVADLAVRPGSVARAEVAAHPRPGVGILSTGDELVEPWERPGPGQIRDANRYALRCAAAALDVPVVRSAIAPDEEGLLRALLTGALADADVLITSGGVSMGQLDLVKVLLDELAEVQFGRVFMKPGKPLHFAVAEGGKLIFGLPGNPVSALVGFELFVRPALLKLAGHRAPVRPRALVALAHEIKPGDRALLALPARRDPFAAGEQVEAILTGPLLAG